MVKHFCDICGNPVGGARTTNLALRGNDRFGLAQLYYADVCRACQASIKEYIDVLAGKASEPAPETEG